MKERPILFSAAMVHAILADGKTQTRRVVNRTSSGRAAHSGRSWHLDDPNATLACPYGQPGDRLWVRETVWIPPSVSELDLREGADTWPKCIYSADTDDTDTAWMRDMRWKQLPSIHMPRWASRITLEITDVRVQRVRDISAEDALAEGIHRVDHGRAGYFYHAARAEPHHNDRCDPIDAFGELWEAINGLRGFGWNANPWVWALTFKRLEPPA